MTRHPETPDCAIEGCTFAVARLGMCRKHADLAPAEFGIRAAIEAADASHRAARAVWADAQAHVTRALSAADA